MTTDLNERIKIFINSKTTDCLALESQFAKIKKHKWNSSVVLIAELNVQLGQLFSILEKTEERLEPERKFDDIGDELSDILLNLLYLSYLEDFNFAEYISVGDIEVLKENSLKSLKSLPIIFGKLSEAILEKNGYRFKKSHGTFPNLESYIRTLISYIYVVIFVYAIDNNIAIEEEFQKMLESAYSFVEQKKTEKKLDLVLKKYCNMLNKTISLVDID